MKSGLKGLVDEYIEGALASSDVINVILKGMTIVATESKKIADYITALNDRLDQHEKIILALVEAQKDKNKGVEAAAMNFNSSKAPQKPN